VHDAVEPAAVADIHARPVPAAVLLTSGWASLSDVSGAS